MCFVVVIIKNYFITFRPNIYLLLSWALFFPSFSFPLFLSLFFILLLFTELIQELIFCEMCHFHDECKPELIKNCESRGRTVVDGRVILDKASLEGNKTGDK